ncbi:unnamed protein product [Arctogadus glacialis]
MGPVGLGAGGWPAGVYRSKSPHHQGSACYCWLFLSPPQLLVTLLIKLTSTLFSLEPPSTAAKKSIPNSEENKLQIFNTRDDLKAPFPLHPHGDRNQWHPSQVERKKAGGEKKTTIMVVVLDDSTGKATSGFSVCWENAREMQR